MGSRAICILGMHRSGTSLITRAVNLLGAYIGETEELKSPSPVNPEGFWERIDIKNLNEKILRHFRLSWHLPAPLPEDWLSLADTYKNKIQELVRKHFFNKSLWAWKDPRTTILFPLWKEALNELGVDLRVVFVVRSPLDVARSLEKRDGFSVDKGLGIWFKYNLCGLYALKDVKALFVSYDRFLTDWHREAERMARLLEIDIDEQTYADIEKAVKPDLRHSYSTIEELEAKKAPKQVIELYKLLIDFSEKDSVIADAGSHSLVTGYMQELATYSRFYRDDMEELLRLQDVDARFKAIEKRISLMAGDIDDRLNKVVEHLSSMKTRLKRVNTSVEELQAKVDCVLESPIWRITGVHKRLKSLSAPTKEKKKKKDAVEDDVD